MALIPARGGSRGFPGKNLAEVGGMSLVRRAVESAKIDMVDIIVVSSDSAGIRSEGARAGAIVIKRSPCAASDEADATSVVMDMITKLPQLVSGIDIDASIIVYLQPTSPLRTCDHVSQALSLAATAPKHRVVSVMRLGFYPQKTLTIGSDGHLRAMFDVRSITANRQSLPDAYYPNGALYIFEVSDFTRQGGFPIEGAVPMVMSKHESIDVDSAEDLQQANRLIQTGILT